LAIPAPIQVFMDCFRSYVGKLTVDADENREIVIKGNYTLAIIRYFLDPDLIFVAIPVIYNICMDYGMDRKRLMRRSYSLIRLQSRHMLRSLPTGPLTFY
jgi:hypothetical protein